MNIKLLEAKKSERFKYRGWNSKTRVYVDIVGESVFDDFANRTSRPYKLFRPIVEQALRDEGLVFDRIGWSQRAGCSCPCSPGFVVYGPQATRGYDIWVRVECSEPAVTNDVTPAFRAQQLLAQI